VQFAWFFIRYFQRTIQHSRSRGFDLKLVLTRLIEPDYYSASAINDWKPLSINSRRTHLTLALTNQAPMPGRAVSLLKGRVE